MKPGPPSESKLKAPVRRRLLGLAPVCLAIALLPVSALVVWDNQRKTSLAAAVVSSAAFEEATGIKVIRVAAAAGGGLLDLRYRVLDPDKAAVVHDRENPPTIIHEATGRAASRPWMGHTSKKELHTAVTYYELLLNPGSIVKRGDLVTVIIGDARLAHVVVQ